MAGMVEREIFLDVHCANANLPAPTRSDFSNALMAWPAAGRQWKSEPLHDLASSKNSQPQIMHSENSGRKISYK